MKRLVLLAAVLFSLLVWGLAVAAVSKANTSLEDRTLSIAASWWHQPCQQPVTVSEDLDWQTGASVGWAYINGCQTPATAQIHTRPVWTLKRAPFCQIIAHEYGHLLGYEHSDPIPIMQNPLGIKIIKPCRIFLPHKHH